MKPLVWVGVRESDIADCDDMFCGSVTIFGNNIGSNRAYCTSKIKRVDHNVNDSVPEAFWNDELVQWVKRCPDIRFMYYNPIHSYRISESLQHHVICRNEIALLNFLDNKAAMRDMVQNAGINIVPYEHVTGKSLSTFSYADGIIIQLNSSSGGNGTFLFSTSERDEITKIVKCNSNCLLSPYLKQSISVNIHFFISDEMCVPLPGSVQIIKEIQDHYRKLLFFGSDYIAFQHLSEMIRTNVTECGCQISTLLQYQGYRGIIGYDFLIHSGKVLFLEANGRFQASTPLLNLSLVKQGLPCAQKLNLLAYNNKLSSISAFHGFFVEYSSIAYLNGTWNRRLPDLNGTQISENIVDIKWDGYGSTQSINPNAYMFKLIFNTNIAEITPEGTTLLHNNLFDEDPMLKEAILQCDPLCVKISLLNQGVRLTDRALKVAGQIKNAVFDAMDIKIFDGLRVNCPKDNKWIGMSPWEIDVDNVGSLLLRYQQTSICSVQIDKVDTFAERETSRGVPFTSASFFATDRLRLHHGPSCKFQQSGKGCLFCDMPINSIQFSIKDIYEIIDFYLEHAVGLRHFLIGGGSHDDEINTISMLARYIRSKSDKRIYAMCLPIEDDTEFSALLDAGVNEIAFNIEIFDPLIAHSIMPGKGAIPRDIYFRALKMATKYWGKDGNVRSLVIAGLEPEESLLNGIKQLCEIGVMPIVSVFRPLRRTAMESVIPPSNTWLYNLYQKAQAICESFNLHLGPSCVDCQNNTLSLPF
jgi:hypothetical protein